GRLAGVVAPAAEDHAVYWGSFGAHGVHGVGELDLAAAAGLGGVEHGEDRAGQDVASDEAEVRGGLLHGRLLDHAGDFDDVGVAGGGDRGDAPAGDVLFGDFHEGEDDAAGL